jgi:uncharacterized membrane protein
MQDRVTQFTLGTFLAAFLYCLFVLRTIRYADGEEFVPHLSVTLGVASAVASLVMLIYFVHHLATSIQADRLVARVAADLNSAVDRLYPEEIGAGQGAPDDPRRGTGAAIATDGDGYIQAIDPDAILNAAVKADALIEVERRPGQYVLSGSPLARVWPGSRLTDDLARAVNASVARGPVRTPVQDIEFVINQIVEIAVRALSPGINDPFTAITCVDRLSSGLARLAQRRLPSAYRADEAGRVRVIAPPVPFPAVLDAAFRPIRQYGRTSPAVIIRLLEALAALARVATDPEHRNVIRHHAELAARLDEEDVPGPSDRADVEGHFQKVCAILAASSGSA